MTADTHFLGDLAFEYLVSDGQSTAVGQAVVTVEPDLSRPNTWIGTSSSEAITGTSADDYLFGFDSDDTLNGDDGNDTLVGGTGNDTLEGGKGDDHYIFGAGDGVDTIVNASSGKPGNDSLHLNGDLNPDNLWFTQLGNDLVIDVVGTNDQITARDWYSDSSAQIDAIYADDQVLYANQVDQLVAAMASFDVPTGVGAIVPQDTRDQVAPVIASSWS
ncbi:hypothetical protein KOI40_00390 [Aestuariicella sp. G3-2]|nr:hypothetical protein [Aestuariicella albida]